MRRFTLRHAHDMHGSGSIGRPKRIFWMLVIIMIALTLIPSISGFRSNSKHYVSYVADPMARMSAKKMQATAAENAVLGGIMAGRRAQPGVSATVDSGKEGEPGNGPEVIVRSPWEPGLKGPVIRITHIRGTTPQLTREAAMNDALKVGRELLEEKLHALDPPIDISLSLNEIRDRYLRTDTVNEVHPSEQDKKEMKSMKIEENRIWLEIELEVSADQLRVIRSEQRLLIGAQTGLLLFVGILIVHLGLRINRIVKQSVPAIEPAV